MMYSLSEYDHFRIWSFFIIMAHVPFLLIIEQEHTKLHRKTKFHVSTATKMTKMQDE